MADNELVIKLEVGAVYLYVAPNFPPDLMICTSNIAGDEYVLTGWYNEINASWEFDSNDGGSFDLKYLRKLAPSLQALVEQVVPFGF